MQTETYYALTARAVARSLGLVQPARNAVLLAGAHRFARGFATALKNEGIECVLVDRNRWNVSRARMSGLNAFYGDILALQTEHELDTSAVGALLAITANNEVNSLGALHFSESLGRQSVYQLPPDKLPKGGADERAAPSRLRGSLLFDPPLFRDPRAPENAASA